MHFNIEISILD